MFIVFDGIDGAGKSTQINLTKQWLEGRGQRVETLYDPGSTELGKSLRQLLLGEHEYPIDVTTEMLMFIAARAQLVAEKVRPALAAGKTVLCDRYTFSTVVYQGYAGGLPIEKIWQANQIATGGLQADLMLLFDLPAEVAFSRLGSGLDRMESRGTAFFEKVREGFLKESKRFPVGVEVVDATQETAAVQATIRRLILVAEQRVGALR
jgi:dTMP kinase